MILPTNERFEKAAIGGLLTDPEEGLMEMVEGFEAGIELFTETRHRILFSTISSLASEKAPINILTVSERLRKDDALDDVGGVAYLAEITNDSLGASTIRYYLEELQRYWVARRMVEIGYSMTTAGQDPTKAEEALEDFEREFLLLGQHRVSGGEVDIRALINQSIDQMERWEKNKGQLDGLGTGFPDLDNMLQGMRGGEMILLAARPSQGKTAIAMQIAEHVALNQKLPVAIFSLEMTGMSLVFRMQCSLARINSRKVRSGDLTPFDFQALTNASAKLASAPIHIRDKSGITIQQLRAAAHRMFKKHKLKLLVVDYLQLMGSKTKAGENREREVAQVSNGLKSISKDLNIPVLVLAQLNREVEKAGNRKPRLSDLRESGSIEADADVCGLLYRPEENPNPDVEEFQMNLLIAKNRNGPTGEVKLHFRKHLTRFESVAKT